jgi:hypothetical protein
LTRWKHRLILTGVLVSLRRIATVVVTLGLLAGAWRPCAGWEATAEARMSCCVRKAACAMHKVAGDGTTTTLGQAEADTCCAASERPNSYQPAAVVIAAPILSPLVGLFAERPSTPIGGMDWRRPPPLLVSRRLPTHLLLSVFLI